MDWFAFSVGLGLFCATLCYFHRRMVAGMTDPLMLLTDPMARSMVIFLTGLAVATGSLGFHGTRWLSSWLSSP